MLSPRSFLVSRQSNPYLQPSPKPPSKPSKSSKAPKPLALPKSAAFASTASPSSPSSSTPSPFAAAPSAPQRKDDWAAWSPISALSSRTPPLPASSSITASSASPSVSPASTNAAAAAAAMAAAAVSHSSPVAAEHGLGSAVAAATAASTDCSDFSDAAMVAAARSIIARDIARDISAISSAERERPTTPTSPVQIPARSSPAHPQKTRRHHRDPDRDLGRWDRAPRQSRPLALPSSDARRRSRDIHSPDAIPPSVAALLALTSIPPPHSARGAPRKPRSGTHSPRSPSGERVAEKCMTVDAIMGSALEAEKAFSFSLSKSPLDVLLSPPEEDLPLGNEEDDDDDGEDDTDLDNASICASTLESPFSTRTVSLESMPSLADSFATGTISSVETPRTPARDRLRHSNSSSSRCRPGRSRSGYNVRPTRRSLTPVSSPPGERQDHPLFVSGSDSDSDNNADDIGSLDFRAFQPSPLGSNFSPSSKTAATTTTTATAESRFPLQPLRSAFKSNLTASLRALRNAARSFSSLNLTSIPPEDFLTRSIFTIDPHIPYTDERRPPLLQEEPSAALRRYLNPTMTAHVDALQPTATQALSPALASASLTPPTTASTVGTTHGSAHGSAVRSAFTASIQMHTYKVHRARSSSSLRGPGGSAGAGTSPSAVASASKDGQAGSTMLEEPPLPGPRQRELRENSDFIRIAVMEMAMRKAGKLDDRKPGRARLALPPRKASARPYQIGDDGVPARWVAVTSA